MKRYPQFLIQLLKNTNCRQYQWQNYLVCVSEKKTILVTDVISETEDQLDFSERIIKVSIAYGYLIATTPIQCYIYSTTNWNTPTIFELKDGSVNYILQSEKYVSTSRMK